MLSQSCGVYNINQLGLQKRFAGSSYETDSGEKTYRCASREMQIFGAIGVGASSIVQRAIHIPSHRILALKKINIFEKVITLLLKKANSIWGCELFSSINIKSLNHVN